MVKNMTDVKIRLQKFMAESGVASRRKSEELIAAGKVKVNGKTACVGDKVNPKTDKVVVAGKKLSAPKENVYIMLNKPRGFITTMSDEMDRKCVAELVSDIDARIYPVGRLDRESEGLLLMTNDGEFANRIMHPQKEIEKKYLVWVSGYREGCEETLRQPIEIDGRMTQPAKLRLLSRKDETALFEFVIHEGRNRQLRRLCEAAGLRVTRLRRIAEGPLTLGELPTGAWRPLNGQELEALERALEGR